MFFIKSDIEQVKKDKNYLRKQIDNTEKQMFWLLNLTVISFLSFMIFGDTIELLYTTFLLLVIFGIPVCIFISIIL